MLTDFAQGSIAKRRLILRDSLAILSLFLATVLLFFITLLLFRSFTAHRADLAQRWSARGSAALGSHRPAEAIIDFRTALSYAPGTRSYELLLAQALAEARQTDEAYQYYLSLWDTTPGDGFINLQLARLAVQRNETQPAINYYRASVYGTWEGDGALRRVDVRLELARYLIAQKETDAAQTELLIIAGNSPETQDLDSTLADLFEQASDPADASIYYERAAEFKKPSGRKPHSR